MSVSATDVTARVVNAISAVSAPKFSWNRVKKGMYTSMDEAEMVLKLMLEGSSVSTIERVTGIHHTTILKLLVLAGEKCERIMTEKIRNVKVRDIECDELWAFADHIGA